MNLNESKEYWDKRFNDFGKFSSGYTDKMIHQFDDKIRWSSFLKEVKINKGDKVLDVGCNYGEWSLRLARLGAEVIGIDIISEAIKMAKKNAQTQSLNASFQEMSLDQINFKNNSFDKIISITVMQHILDDQSYKSSIKKMFNQLKKNGELILIESASNYKIDENQKHKRERIFDKQINFLQEAGFKLHKTRGVNHLSSKCFYLLEKIPVSVFIKRKIQFIFLIILNPFDLFLSRFSSLSKFSKLKLMIFQKI